MQDQAFKLREMAQRHRQEKQGETRSSLRVVAVASGKGGVGKTNVVVNLAISLAKMGQRVVIFDADLGLANADIIMGIIPKFTLWDVLQGRKSLEEILIDGPYGIKLIPGGSGIQELANLEYYQREKMLQGLRHFEEADFLLIDTGAGISRNVLAFMAAADEVIVVITPEPTSITDAYGLIKILSRLEQHSEVHIIINRTNGKREAEQTMAKIEAVVNKFLQIKVRQLGHICEDQVIGKAVKSQKPFVMLFPNSSASRELGHIARNLVHGKAGRHGAAVKDGFVERLLRLFV